MNEAVAEMKSRVSTAMYTGADRLGTQITIAAEPGQQEVKVDPAVLRAELRQAGAPQWIVDLVKEPDSPHKRLKRAVGNTGKGKNSKRDAEKGNTLVWVRGKIDSGVLSYVLYDLTADPSNPKGAAVSTVSVAKNGGMPLVNHFNTPTDDYITECNAVVKRYSDSAGWLNSNNIRDLVNDVILGNFAKEQKKKKDHEKKGVGYRRRVRHGVRLLGSVSYLVPKGEDEEVFTMAEPLLRVGYGTATNSVMGHDVAQFGSQIERSATSALNEMEADFKAFIEGQKAANDGEGPKKYVGSSYSDRQDRLDDMLAQAVFFEDKMGCDLDRVVTLINQLKSRIEAGRKELWDHRF